MRGVRAGEGTDLRERLRLALAEGRQRALRRGRPVLVSVAVPFPHPPDPLGPFAAAHSEGRTACLWAHPSEGFQVIGVDAALAVALHGPSPLSAARHVHRETLEEAVLDAPDLPGVGPWFLGCFRFDPRGPRTAPWKDLPDGLLLLPRLTLARVSEGAWLTVNALASPNPGETEDPAPEFAPRAARPPAGGPRGGRVALSLQGSRAAWERAVGRVLRGIAEGRWRKVTLARSVRLRSPTPWDPADALRHLLRAYPACRVFAVAWQGTCFLGASPEVLVGLREGRLSSLCLAGSAPRGATAEEDGARGRALLEDPKERREHGLVVEWIARRLRPRCPDLAWDDPPFLLKLETVQHLATSFAGPARPGEHLLDLVEALHPTPAVAGVPLEGALQVIRLLEERERGWYAGPVGWLDRRGEGEFSIAIRSALLRGRDAFLYAGAGIVAGSDPRKEWRETGLKLRALLMALRAA